jgi:3',5'-cyclic AMP phosphodiesterase CpdA
MDRDITFIHMTDLHIGHAPHPGVDTSASLDHVLRQVSSLRPKPGFVILSGDLADFGTPANYEHLREQLRVLDMPVIYALGNHDMRSSFYSTLLGRRHDMDAPYYFATVIEGVHIVVLDSSKPGFVGGTLVPRQLEWLERELDAEPGLPKLIVSHHPPAVGASPGKRPWTTLDFEDSQRLGSMLRGRNILGILSGHVHHDSVTLWNGIPIVISTGLHTAVDSLFTEGVRVVTGGSFSLCTIRPSGLTAIFVPLPSDRSEIRRIYDKDRGSADR